MKKLGFYANIHRDENLRLTNRLIDYADGLGFSCVIENKYRKNYGAHNNNIVFCDNIFETADFIVVLGGDGTMLAAAKPAAVHGKPILGINLGKLGFLTATDKFGGEKILKSIAEDRYAVEERIMLKAISANENPGWLALNDVCLSKDSRSRPCGFEISINGEFIDSYIADGVIISTPTGSTAYNLSAGGPLIKPDLDLFAVTPVCPHNLYARPFVVSSNDTIVVKSVSPDDRRIIAAIDGEDVFSMTRGEKISFVKSEYKTRIIKTQNSHFYALLREKLVREMP